MTDAPPPRPGRWSARELELAYAQERFDRGACREHAETDCDRCADRSVRAVWYCRGAGAPVVRCETMAALQAAMARPRVRP